MQNFKKNLGFNLALISAGILFVCLAGKTYFGYAENQSSASELKRATAAQNTLLKGYSFVPQADPVSLNEDNVKKAADDVAELEAHVAALRIAVAGNPEFTIKGKASANSAELSANLRESVDTWRKNASDQGIKLSATDPTAFGFHRYIYNQGTSPKRDFQKVDQQRQIIDFIVKQLAESRSVGSPLLIESVDREAVETYVLIPEGKPGAGTYGPEVDVNRSEVDEFIPTRTFNRRALVDTLSFRVRFVGYTPTLRTFVNKIRNSGRPLAITTIEVGLASKETEKLLAASSLVGPGAVATAAGSPSAFGGFFGAEETVAPTPGKKIAPSSEDKRALVVPRKLSAFVVQIDYLSIPEEVPTAGTEGEPKK